MLEIKFEREKANFESQKESEYQSRVKEDEEK